MNDCISRQAVLDLTWEEPSYTDALNVLTEIRDKVKALPSVTPTERTGHWINDRNKNNVRCSVCGRGYKDVCATASITSYSYCPNCGARMVEPQEGEE